MTATTILRHMTVGIVTLGMMLGSFLAVAPTQAHAQEEDVSTTDVHFFGQIIELASTELPTTIVVRENPTGEFTDYTVDMNTDTSINILMDHWIVGDYVNVWGSMDDQTGVVTATRVDNKSMGVGERGLNGWIDEIGEDYVVVQWQDVLHTVHVTDNTNLVGDEGPHGTLEDFEVGDRVRLRLIPDSEHENEARIIIVLRRGPWIFNLARTRGFYATLVDLDTDENTMVVELLANDHLWDGDVNNLIGVEGDQVTVTYDDDTKLKRKYTGDATEDEMLEGDRLQIVGRVNDDGTVSARVIRDTNIFAFGVHYRVGEILEINTEENYFVVENARMEEPVHEWTIFYDDETNFFLDREGDASEDALEVGLLIRVRGVANNVEHEVTAKSVAVFDETKPTLRPKARLHKLLSDVREYFAEEGDSDEDEVVEDEM